MDNIMTNLNKVSAMMCCTLFKCPKSKEDYYEFPFAVATWDWTDDGFKVMGTDT